MPSDPKECRKQRLAQSWLRVADDLERAEAYLLKRHAGKKRAG
jgi:hypothetical protein